MKLLWLDIETTGLDRQHDQVLEVAVSVADVRSPYQAKPAYHTVLHYARDNWDKLDPWVLKTHTENGLLLEAAASTVTIADVERDLLELVPVVANRADMWMLAGSSVHFDMSFLMRDMPTVMSRMSHRIFDVSTVKLFCQSKGMSPFPKGEAHRAVDDVIESIEHCRQCDQWLQDHFRDVGGGALYDTITVK